MIPRTMIHEYFNLTDLPIGEIPYTAIQRALRDEKYLRKFTPTFCRNDLLAGNFSALLYWFPHYTEQLFELAVEGVDYKIFFKGLPIEIVESFDFLFPELHNRLDRAKEISVKLNALDEIKIKRKRPNYKKLEEV